MFKYMGLNPEKGHRKFVAIFRAQIFLLLGLIVVGLLKLPADLYWAYVGGVAGNAASFMWGNSKEHAASAAATPKQI